VKNELFIVSEMTVTALALQALQDFNQSIIHEVYSDLNI